MYRLAVIMGSLFGGFFLPLGARTGCVISSPEPLGSQCELIGSGELIVYTSSRRPSVRPSSVHPFNKSSSPEPAGRIP